jgi:uncharacterized protein with FMN-binding domain
VKRVLVIIALGLLLVILGFSVWATLQGGRMQRALEAATVEDVDLSQVADGVYTGRFEAFPVMAEVRVTVVDHKIATVEVTKQRHGPGRAATDVPVRIVRAQTPKVDVTTSATYSSRCIMAAVYQALSQSPR